MNRRRHFTKDTLRHAYARSGGICECYLIPQVFDVPCGRPLGEGNIFYEHVNADRADNSLENCACLTRTCWRFKTSTYDQPVIARIRRVSDLARGIKDPWRRRLPGGRDSGFRIKLDRRVELREPR